MTESNNKTKKAKKKKRKNYYFTQEVQDKIELFQKTECVATKNKIFDVHILPAFRDLVQSLISVYKFKATNEDIDHLKSDCVTFLFETIYISFYIRVCIYLHSILMIVLEGSK